MNIHRDPRQPFSLEELKHISASIKKEDDINYLSFSDESGMLALQAQIPQLYKAWMAFTRAQAELFHYVGQLDEHIKHLENQQQCQSET